MYRILRKRPRRGGGDHPSRSGKGDRRHRTADGHDLRQRHHSAAGIGPFGRTRLDAGYDGHHPQPRSERHRRRGPCQTYGQRPFRMGLLPPLRTDVRRRGTGHEASEQRGRRSVRGHHRRNEEGARRQTRHGALHRRPARTGREVQGGREGAYGSRLPHRSVGTALGRHHGRIPELDERTRHPLP